MFYLTVSGVLIQLQDILNENGDCKRLCTDNFVAWLWPKHSYPEHWTAGNHTLEPLGQVKRDNFGLNTGMRAPAIQWDFNWKYSQRVKREYITQTIWRTKVFILRQHETDVENYSSNHSMNVNEDAETG